MSQFRFRLQTLLDFRVRKEDELKRGLAEIQKAILREQRALEELERGRQEAATRYSELAASALDVEREQLFRIFYSKLCLRIEDKQTAISELNEELDAQRDRVVEAMRERKTVQSLRDKQLEQFQLGELRKEQAFLDDIATTRYVANQLTEGTESA